MDAQRAICEKYKADFLESKLDLKLGISRNISEGISPINGLRLYPEGDTTGWFIWAGEEISQDPNFFISLHVEHIEVLSKDINKY
jgi:hypothetical protein